ncbi:MAG: hypothetical protein MUE94_00335 [Verrucomicrobia bacterium]|nr:hypothetical protein [Verrucomicrobiota bacterium]
MRLSVLLVAMVTTPLSPMFEPVQSTVPLRVFVPRMKEPPNTRFSE